MAAMELVGETELTTAPLAAAGPCRDDLDEEKHGEEHAPNPLIECATCHRTIEFQNFVTRKLEAQAATQKQQQQLLEQGQQRQLHQQQENEHQRQQQHQQRQVLEQQKQGQLQDLLQTQVSRVTVWYDCFISISTCYPAPFTCTRTHERTPSARTPQELAQQLVKVHEETGAKQQQLHRRDQEQQQQQLHLQDAQMRVQQQLLDAQCRIDVLQACEIMDTPPNEDVDKLCAIAKDIWEVPIVLATLLDDKRQVSQERPAVQCVSCTIYVCVLEYSI